MMVRGSLVGSQDRNGSVPVVIPALIPYIKVVAGKELIVGFRPVPFSLLRIVPGWCFRLVMLQ